MMCVYKVVHMRMYTEDCLVQIYKKYELLFNFISTYNIVTQETHMHLYLVC